MSKSLEKILIQDLLRAWGWSLAPLEIQVSRLVDLAVVWLSAYGPMYSFTFQALQTTDE